MARVPKVYFYTPKGQYVNLSGIGNPGDHLYKFSYKYSETEDDTCRVILAFNRTNIDLTFLQPGIAYHIRWGYIGGRLSGIRSVIVNKATYKYSASGFSVTLDMVPSAAYKGEATIRDPNGDSLEETLVDGAKEVGQVGFTYTTSSGQQLQVIKVADGYWQHKQVSANGEVSVDLSEETKAGIHNLVKKGKEENLTAQEIADRKATWEKYYAAQLLYATSSPGISPGVQTQQPIPLTHGLVTHQDFLKGLSYMLQAKGANTVLKIRDGSVTTETVDWGADPTFGLVASAGLISWTAEKADKEDKLVGREAATIDPLTKSIKSTKVFASRKFRTKYLDIDGKTLIEAKVYQKGDSYYMEPIAIAGEPVTQPVDPKELTKTTYNILLDQSVNAQALRDQGLSESQIDQLVLDGKPLKGTATGLANLDQYLADQQVKEQYEAWGIEPGAVEVGYVKPLYSGDTAEQLKDKAIHQTLNQIFYNLKLTVVTEGNPRVEDRVNFTFVTGNKDIDYIYHLDESEHTISSAGYTTRLVGYKVAPNVERIATQANTIISEGLAASFPEVNTEKTIIAGIRELNLQLGATLTTHAYTLKNPLHSNNLKPGENDPFYNQNTEGDPYVDLRSNATKLVDEKYEDAIQAEIDTGGRKSFNPNQTVDGALDEYNNTPKDE